VKGYARTSRFRRLCVPVLTLGAFVLLGSCADAPRAPVVVPARPISSVAPLDVEPSSSPDGGAARAVGPRVVGSFSGVCMVAKGRVFCSEPTSPRKPLGGSPSLGFDHVVDVTFGRDFACALDTSGKVSCNGGNTFGQLGAGLSAERQEPVVQIPRLEHVKALRAGPFTVCAILENGKLSCWGKNQSGESGSDTQYLEAARELVEPAIVPGLEGVEEVASAWDTTCAVTRAHETHCFGRARTAEHERLAGRENEVPHKLPSLSGISSLVANEAAFCAIKDRHVVCWGDLGSLTRDSEPGTSTVHLKIPSARRVCLGTHHGCVLDESGDVHCFGSPGDGKLGRAISTDEYQPHRPTRVEGLPRMADLACSGSSTCATTEAGEVFCWGRFSYGGGEDDVASAPVKMRIFGE
jgi:alpha-tubulin suppressor-like RCC1 family protein